MTISDASTVSLSETMAFVHDLRTSLATIHGSAELLIGAELSEVQVRRLAQNLYKASLRMNELLEECLTRYRRTEESATACDLRQLVEETYTRLARTRKLKRTLDAAGLEAAANNLRGLTEDEAERSLSQAIVSRYSLCPEVVTDVLEAKKETLRRSGMLEFIEASASMGSIGGLENLKRWLGQRKGAWEDSARAYGLDPPRGVIIMGVQGCGKSLCARAIAGEWQLPLVKFDTAAVYDKYIGETEKNIRKIFSIAEQLAPAVLWIDELEKVFAGSAPDSA